MFILSISLNALTLTVTALTIGLGIDYTIYITQRFREERRSRRPGEAMQKAIENIGVPIFLCALTTWAGFGVLTLSPMPLTQQFGIITATTIAYSFILAVFVFPLFLEGLSRFKRKGDRSEGFGVRGVPKPEDRSKLAKSSSPRRASLACGPEHRKPNFGVRVPGVERRRE